MGSGEYFASSPRKKEIFCSVFSNKLHRWHWPQLNVFRFFKMHRGAAHKAFRWCTFNSWKQLVTRGGAPVPSSNSTKAPKNLSTSRKFLYSSIRPLWTEKKKIKIKSYALLLVSVLTLFGSYKLQTVRSHQNLHRWQKENLERSKTKPELAARHRTKHRHYQY